MAGIWIQKNKTTTDSFSELQTFLIDTERTTTTTRQIFSEELENNI